MKGVLLAGGTGKRMRPLSDGTNKHLLAVDGRPLVSYSLHTLVSAGITDIALVTGVEHVDAFRRVLGTGGHLGCRLSYFGQEHPLGTANAVQLVHPFTGSDDFVVVLGDNIFMDNVARTIHAFERQKGCEAKVLLRPMHDVRGYAVAVLDGGRVVDVIEKPVVAPSNYVSTGLWMLRQSVFQCLRNIHRSPRGEYEMTDVLAQYARARLLAHAFLRRKWMDVGSVESLLQASACIRRGRNPPFERAPEIKAPSDLVGVHTEP